MEVDGGWIITPGGVGRYVEYIPATGKVVVEMDYEYLVEFDGDECYPAEIEDDWEEVK